MVLANPSYDGNAQAKVTLPQTDLLLALGAMVYFAQHSLFLLSA
jgi:hypothetical protein